ncbi:aromatic ring-hydroxylating dioxygenase subunit alpha [Novosphingobium sp. KCTC 2891]|uniref:aromatic ring-hydroxylating oxygenase subunit alpha n=1 Tax=Novosphingobium sp. KCTC 2891 TaxID=2989730 RepID=UPI002222927C|nr:aromatic ring-hydroxylating dioxygenase subunit alpha [Novosphingobium sp. KCTC 2891]MCW1382934.1 aromatic ring-hydroxylating dioxygenase subunit alpha [Novosphingobium sp. KCTC 2891]
MNVEARNFRTDRHPAETYEEILERDTRPIPEHLREGPVPDIGTEPVDVARYIDPAFARLEEKYLWPRIWQMACREEEIPNVGDTYVYEIAGRSLLVVRQKDGSIRAFHNSCLHRGRKLATLGGCKNEFRCPYHGIAWNTDGSFKDNPIAWDFPQWQGKDVSLPEVKVGTWGGFVFVNLDKDAPPLEQVLGPLPEHFAGYGYEDRYIHFHVQKTVACNWKAAAEGFMESHHAITTHPQLLPYLADVNSQYDILTDYVTRQFSAQMVPSPYNDREITENEVVQAVLGVGSRSVVGGAGKDAMNVPDGETARTFMAEFTRRSLGADDGHDYSAASDAEMVDALLYNVFPHMSFWAGFMPSLVYRWRPNGHDHATSIMDIYMLKRVPKGQPRPRPAPVFEIGLDESMVEYGPKAGLSPGLAAVFEQDMSNLPHVQTGMEASEIGVCHLGRYSELRIRKMHQMLDQTIAEGKARDAAQAG